MKNRGAKAIGARNDNNDVITHILKEGNTRYTPLKQAIKQAEKGELDLVVVRPKDGDVYLRTRPDDKPNNNLDELAKRNK